MQWSPPIWLRRISGLGVLVVFLKLWTGFRVDSTILYVLRRGHLCIVQGIVPPTPSNPEGVAPCYEVGTDPPDPAW